MILGILSDTTDQVTTTLTTFGRLANRCSRFTALDACRSVSCILWLSFTTDSQTQLLRHEQRFTVVKCHTSP